VASLDRSLLTSEQSPRSPPAPWRQSPPRPTCRGRSGPIIHRPGMAAGHLRHLGRPGNRLRLRGGAAVEQTGVVDGYAGRLSG